MSEAGKIGFVSLGCPKALVDSERILTQLRTEGYQIEPAIRVRIWWLLILAGLSIVQSKSHLMP